MAISASEFRFSARVGNGYGAEGRGTWGFSGILSHRRVKPMTSWLCAQSPSNYSQHFSLITGKNTGNFYDSGHLLYDQPVSNALFIEVLEHLPDLWPKNNWELSGNCLFQVIYMPPKIVRNLSEFTPNMAMLAGLKMLMKPIAVI